jgi:viroplasmin and RNaseH domain-containing protein
MDTQVRGFPGAKHKSFALRSDAEAFVRLHAPATSATTAPATSRKRPASAMNSVTSVESKGTFYAVAVGRSIGIYDSWAGCLAQVRD